MTALRSVAVLRGDVGVNGVVWFSQDKESGPTKIKGEISGLSPGAHGLHVHHYGDSTNGCVSAGPHFNPLGVVHGGREVILLLFGNITTCEFKSAIRHVGDLGNIEAGSDGKAKFEFEDKHIQLSGVNNIIGRSLVVHGGEDDLGLGQGDKKEESQKTGNAGARVACGVVAIASNAN